MGAREKKKSAVPGRFAVFSLDHLAETYGAAISSARIYQLYIFWILIETLWIPLNTLISAFSQGLDMLLTPSSQAMTIDWSTHLDNFRFHTEFPWFVLAWICFYTYTAFNRFYPILVCVAAGLLHNQFMAYTLYDKRSAAEKYPDAPVDLTAADLTSMWLFFGGLALVHVYFLALSLYGQRRIHQATADEKAILSEYPGGGSLFKSAARILNLPPALRMARRKIAATLLLFISGISNYSNYILCSVMFMGTSSFIPLGVWYVQTMTGMGATASGTQLAIGYALGAVMVIISMLIAFVTVYYILVLGRWATKAVRRLLSRSLEEVQALDPRPPILFLRSFADDQVALTPRRFDFKQWFLDETSRSMNLDYLILQEGTEVGPTVALGKPGDPAPPYGVARGYFEHNDWKKAVSNLCQQAKGIILVLDTTEGVAWEIELLLAQSYLPKTLVLLKQEDCGTEQGQRLLRLITDKIDGKGEVAGLLRDRTGGKQGEVLGLWMDASGKAHLLTTTRASSYAYQMALRLFLRNLAGTREFGVP